MLTKISATVAGTGFLSFIGIACYMVHAPHSGSMFMWPMMAAVWSMALGLLVLSFSVNREDRQEELARLVSHIHG